MRPLGAFIFGRAADRFGRRPTLMVDVLLYSILEFASGFSPNLTVLIVLRALFGVAMGGEWGVGASLTMENDSAARPRLRLRPAAIGLSDRLFPRLHRLRRCCFRIIGWRGMFMVGVLPALLVLYIRRNVPESPSWSKEAAVERGIYARRPEIALAARRSTRWC